MDISRADASAALADLEAAQTRSATLRGYQAGAPHLIIWGIAWSVGYVVSDLAPAWSNVAWPVISIAGAIGDIAAARADRRRSGHAGALAALLVIFLVFVAGTLAVMQPGDPRQVGAFIPLVVAAGYAVIGVMGAPRLLVLAGMIAALTLGGFFVLPAHFLLWMAVVGGGSLVLGGIWLRQV